MKRRKTPSASLLGRTLEAMMGKTHMAFGALFAAGGLPIVGPAIGLSVGIGTLVTGVAIGAGAAVLPDIDHPNSLITQGYLPGSGAFGPIGRGLGTFLSIPPRIVGALARVTMSHRGPTHSLLFAAGWTLLAVPIYAAFFSAFAALLALIASPVLALAGYDGSAVLATVGSTTQMAVSVVWSNVLLISLAVFLGYLSHLFADSLNNAPVPWPWPLKVINRGRWFLLPKGLRIKTGKLAETYLVYPLTCLLAIGVFVLEIYGMYKGGAKWL